MTFTNIKKLSMAEAPTSSTAVYTAPSTTNNQAQVTRIKAHNSGAIAASLELRDNHATNNILYNLTISFSYNSLVLSVSCNIYS